MQSGFWTIIRPSSQTFREFARTGARLVKKFLPVTLLCLFLTGCSDEELYSNLEETDANKILGLLMARDIPARKVEGKENKYSVMVPRDDFARAVDLLEWYGIPKKNYSGVGEVFQKSGMVSTPSEERIRFTYALSQDIAKMLSHIDGVITASVQLVLPQNDPYTESTSPSSASVFLKFRPGDLPATLEPQVKQLVMNSVQGLTYDKVAVTIMQSQNIDLYYPIREESKTTSILGMQIAKTSASRLYTAAGVGGGVLVIVAGAAGFFFAKSRKKPAAKSGEEAEGDEPNPDGLANLPKT